MSLKVEKTKFKCPLDLTLRPFLVARGPFLSCPLGYSNPPSIAMCFCKKNKKKPRPKEGVPRTVYNQLSGAIILEKYENASKASKSSAEDERGLPVG